MNKQRSGTARLLIIFALAGCSACTTLPKPDSGPQSRSHLVAEVLSGAAVLGHDYREAELPNDDILLLTEEMQVFLDRYVRPHSARRVRAAALLKALLHDGMLGLEYSVEDTLTAAEAFRSLRANCLAFSNLYVAMAREVGLNADFQDVMVAPQWELSDGSMTLRRHVNVLLTNMGRFDQTVDIGRSRFSTIQRSAKRLTDTQAFAQYYNNLAVESLSKGNYKEAFLYSRKALELDRNSAFIWSNLGVIVSRFGKIDHAEAVLQKAASLDHSEHSALVNLANIYRTQGMPDLAEQYEQQVRVYRLRNPYYLVMYAAKENAAGRSGKALSLLLKAKRLKGDEALIFDMLSKLYYAQGRLPQAIDALQGAREAAETQEQKTQYNQRLLALREEEKRINHPQMAFGAHKIEGNRCRK